MKYLKVLLPILLIPTLTGCGGSMLDDSKCTSFGAVSSVTSTAISYSVQKADGTLVYSINVKESHALEIKASVELDKGAITVGLKNKDGEEKYKEIIIETTNFSIPIETYGKYKITVICDDFKGKFAFSWSK